MPLLPVLVPVPTKSNSPPPPAFAQELLTTKGESASPARNLRRVLIRSLVFRSPEILSGQFDNPIIIARLESAWSAMTRTAAGPAPRCNTLQYGLRQQLRSHSPARPAPAP